MNRQVLAPSTVMSNILEPCVLVRLGLRYGVDNKHIDIRPY
jgi:hypothetical protein